MISVLFGQACFEHHSGARPDKLYATPTPVSVTSVGSTWGDVAELVRKSHGIAARALQSQTSSDTLFFGERLDSPISA
ncbi:hypothetical protein BKG76_21980 [Mycobacteroides franklinii]|uniref:Uncharacterized protein n=1 Tax=Mycobacteroides franklinii TaxID=948102 RepID=A0A1S1L3Q6_9MYCO|nr:hypothetical protein [Mycobacteroides franklinii]OHU19149.1 hypothetical protein BKG76_21980 [Mycobacteroides franklinii]